MLTIITALIVISILILVHELGHFFAAKKSGMRVEEFGFGYPPRLWAKKIKGTVYSLNLLPVGGFVRLYGEEMAEAERMKKKRVKSWRETFWAQSKKARAAVISAGVLANFLLAILVFSITYTIEGIPEKFGGVNIIAVLPGSPAEEAGLVEDDLVVSLDGRPIKELAQFIESVKKKEDQPLFLVIQRDQGTMEFQLNPRKEPPTGEGPLGVLVADVHMVHYPFWQMPFRGAVEGFKEAFAWARLILGGLKMMVMNLISKGEVPRDVAGPLGIIQLTGRVAQDGMIAVLQFVGILSVNLAIVNFLPFPALDGGRFMFVLYETITRRRPRPSFERWVNATGMAFLLLLVFLLTVNDLARIWETSKIAEQLRDRWPFK